MNARGMLLKAAPYLGAVGVAMVCTFLLAAIFLTALDLQWITFLAGILVAACIALASRASHSAWTIARRTAQLAAARTKLAAEAERRAEAERAAAQLRATVRFVDELPAMVSFVDRERRLRYHNRAYGEALGRPGENLVGCLLEEIVGAAANAQIAPRIDEALAGATVRFERSQRRADGHAERLAVQYLPQFGEGGKVSGFFSILTDITGRDDLSLSLEPRKTYARTMATELTPWTNAAQRLRSALDGDEFTLYAQPIAALDSKRAAHPFTELFLRLREEEQGLMAPGAFLPLAEEYGMLAELDGWVVRRVHQWVRGDPAARRGLYSLNVSAATIASKDFVELVVAEMRASGTLGPTLCFEFGEGDCVQNPEATAAFMRRLRAKGCRFALSGFGREPLSFQVLKDVKFDYLKIDAGIVLNMTASAVDQAKVKAINRVAHDLDALTIGVCVESTQALRELRRAGTDYAQGFELGAPMPLEIDAHAGAIGSRAITSIAA